MLEVLTSVATAAAVVGVGFILFRALRGVAGAALPDFGSDGGRVSTVELKTFIKGGSPFVGAGDRQSGGFLELTPERLRSGSLVSYDVPYRGIESVHVKPFGLTRIVVFEFPGDVKSLAATVRRGELPRILNYLRGKSVNLAGPLSS